MNNTSEIQMLKQFEADLGIQLPEGLKQLLIHPIELEEFDKPSVESFISLEESRASLPTRVIPLFNVRSGDLSCLYYPRDSELVIACYYSIGEAVLIPQAADLATYFKAPDKSSPFHPDNDDEVPQESSENWQSLLYDFNSLCPELELLKSFGFNSTYFGETDLEILGKLVARFSPSSHGDASTPQSIISSKYEDALSLLDRSWWMELAELFVQHELWKPAIIALENCESVHNVHPYYGFTKQGNKDMLWSNIYDVLLKLNPLISAHGDALDKATFARKLEIVTSYARDEEREARWYPK